MRAAPDSGSPIEIAELAPGDRRLGEALAVMRALRSSRSIDELERLFAEGHETSGYRIAALFDAGQCRAVTGFRVVTSSAYGRHLYVDDLVTAEQWRSRRYGERLESHLHEVARAEGCGAIALDSGVQRSRAHRFYFRRGYAIVSFRFARRVDGGAPSGDRG